MKTPSSVRFSQILLLIITALSILSLILRFFSSPVPDVRSAVVMILDREGIIGTGTLIDPETVLTSKHFLVAGERYGVRFSDSSSAWVASLTIHPALDLALLRLDTKYETGYPRIFRQKPSWEVPVVAFGAQIQDATIVERRGVILRQDATVKVGDNILTGLIVSDIPFQAGYSGGPLLSHDGEIIGVHTVYETWGQVGWSTPVTRKIIEEIRSINAE